MALTPVKLQLLLTAYTQGFQDGLEHHPPSTQEALAWALKEKLVEEEPKKKGHPVGRYVPTERGNTLIQHILGSVLPEQVTRWEMPKVA